MTPSLKQEAFGGGVAEIHVRQFPLMNGFRLTFSDGSAVTDMDGQHIIFPTMEAANAFRKMTGRQVDEWAKRATDAQILARMTARNQGG